MLSLLKQELTSLQRHKVDFNLETKPNPAGYSHLPDKVRMKIDKKLARIKPLRHLLSEGMSIHSACQTLIKNGTIACSEATLRRDFNEFKNGKAIALKSKSFGTKRKIQDWEKKAAELYLKTSKPTANAIASQLRWRFGYTTATYYRVVNFLKIFAKNGPKRAGKHNHRLNHGRYKDRHTDNLMVGDCYMGDGHRMDIRIAHPTTGHPVRMEMTAWMDVKSRYIVGVYFENDESSLGTLYSLSEAIDNYDHVPLIVYVDNGAGFKSKTMTDKHVGFYQRNDIKAIFSIPGNARGKAQIERFFKTFEQQCLALVGTGYCGRLQDPKSDAIWFNSASKKAENILSLNQIIDEVKTYIVQYNNQPHGGIGAQAPADLWRELKKSPAEENGPARTRPQVMRKIQHGGRIALHSRQYDSSLLVSLIGAEVVVEYSLLNDSSIDVFDLLHNFIAKVDLVKKIAMIPTSRIEEAKDSRLKSQLNRLGKKIKQAEQQAMPVIGAQAQAIGLQAKNKIDLDISQLSRDAERPKALIDIDIRQLSTE